MPNVTQIPDKECKIPFEGGELRYAQDLRGKIYLDEVIASDIKFLHAETMSDQHLWIGLDLANGTTIHLNIFSVNGKSHIDYRAEVYAPEKSDP